MFEEMIKDLDIREETVRFHLFLVLQLSKYIPNWKKIFESSLTEKAVAMIIIFINKTIDAR